MKFSRLKELSLASGIDLIGITNEYDASKIKERLKFRKDNDYNTEFEEDIEKRIYIDNIFKEWKTIIAVGVSYNNKIVRKEKNYRLVGYITKSALELDYHKLMNVKIQKLVGLMKKELGEFKYKIGVDTSPLLDREIAKNADIGFFGKNNSIINEIYGSFIFLGYILIDKEILKEQKKIFKIENETLCKNCNICIKACPTGALKEENIMNAKICISYLTQTKNEIPYKLREKMNKSLYGCDICQKVCPYNKKAYLKENRLDDQINIEDIIFMSKKEFKERYGDKAFSWRGKNIIKRNAIIALSKVKNEEAKKILLTQLEDESKMIRNYTIWSLYKLNIEKYLIEKKSGKFKNENIDEYNRIEGFYAKEE